MQRKKPAKTQIPQTKQRLTVTLEDMMSGSGTNIQKALKKVSEQEDTTKVAQSKQIKKPNNHNQRKKLELDRKKQACTRYLLNTYPKIFSFKKPVPLKVGISKDIHDTNIEFSKYIISSAFWFYTKQHKYLKVLTEDARRFDLTGQPVGVVNAKEAEYAQELLKSRIRQDN